MPKDYRERRIDAELPRFHTRHAKRTTSEVAVPGDVTPDPFPEPAATDHLIYVVQSLTPGETTFDVPDLAPGDVVVWALRQVDTADPFVWTAPSTPTGVMKIYTEPANVEQSWSMATVSASLSTTYPNYLWKDYGDYQADADTSNPYLEKITLVFYPLAGITAGAHRLEFTLPAGDVSEIMWGQILRNVDLDNIGAAAGTTIGALPKKAYDAGGTLLSSNYPVTVSVSVPSAYLVAYPYSNRARADYAEPPPSSFGTVVDTFYSSDPVTGRASLYTSGFLCDTGVVTANHTYTDPTTTPQAGATTNFYLYWLALYGIPAP
jgi:hypothetical protein